MQNKPNLVRRRRIANERNFFYIKGLWKEIQLDTWWKQTQNKPNLPEGKIDAKCVVTKDYEEKCG